MARYREYNQNQGFFRPVDPEAVRKNNAVLEGIDNFVEKYTDVQEFASRLRNEETGAPAVHPKLLLKVVFYSYAHGVYSAREMEARLGWDQNYQVLAAGETVDYSTICNFLKIYREEIKKLFSKMMYVFNQAGLVDGDFLVVDGSKIGANASREFTATVEDFQRKKEKLESKIEQLLASSQQESAYRSRIERKIEVLQKNKERIERFFRESDSPEGKKKVNLTDPDSAMIRDKGNAFPGYNCQAAVEGKNHLIVSSDVFGNNADPQNLQPMVEQIRAESGNDLSRTEIVFDAGYFSAANLLYCEREKLEVYLPEGQAEGGTKRRPADGRVTVRDCKFEMQTRELICPGNQRLKPGIRIRNGYRYYRYYPTKKQCDGCAFHPQCVGTSPNKSFLVGQDYFHTFYLREKMKEKLSSPHGKQRRAQRACTIEHVFGEIKELKRFRRFMHRGLNMVKLIWTLVCIGHNFRKVARLGFVFS